MGKPPLRAQPWPPGEPGEKFRDDRLVWLAARPELARMGRPWWLALMAMGGNGGIIQFGGSGRQAGLNNHTKREYGNARMRRLAVACDDVAARLTAEELARVRATGELPEWFFPAVKAAVRG